MRRHTIARRQKAKEKCKRVEKVIADRSYDTHRIFRDMYERGIEQGILPRSSAKISGNIARDKVCLLYTSPSPRDRTRSRMPSSA